MVEKKKEISKIIEAIAIKATFLFLISCINFNIFSFIIFGSFLSLLKIFIINFSSIKNKSVIIPITILTKVE